MFSSAGLRDNLKTQPVILLAVLIFLLSGHFYSKSLTRLSLLHISFHFCSWIFTGGIQVNCLGSRAEGEREYEPAIFWSPVHFPKVIGHTAASSHQPGRSPSPLKWPLCHCAPSQRTYEKAGRLNRSLSICLSGSSGGNALNNTTSLMDLKVDRSFTKGQRRFTNSRDRSP